jgi:rod shape-determining protein MreC
MDSFYTRYKNVLVLVTVLLVQTIGLAVQVRRPAESGAPDGPRVTLLRTWMIGMVTPFERFFHGIGYNTRHGWSNYIDLRHTRQQNQDLQQEIARLRLEQSELAEDARQGHRLQALLNFQQHYVIATVAAQVIGSSGTDQSRVLYIDKGAKDGLRVDQAVITPDGIVGKLRDVQSGTAQVLLINDQSSGAGVLLATTRIRAILKGSLGGQIVINNLTPDARIKPGEQVLTSGGDQVYPRGLPVGTITSVEPDVEHQPYTLIKIKPSTNLFQLEEVLIITGTQGDLPAIAQQDLAQGLKTAEERAAAAAAAKKAAEEAAAEQAAQSAAEMVGEKLPSLHDGETKTDSTDADPAKSTDQHPAGVVPKPLPVQHPDRYSSGATPPANDLKPGAEHPTGAVAAPQPAPRTPKSSDPASDTTAPQTASPNN